MHDRHLITDGSRWFARWEAMMNAYNPWRVRITQTMLNWPGWETDRKLRILDLGCGPGSLALAARRWFPWAAITAVDFDPLLLEIGRQERRAQRAGIEFHRGDLRDPLLWQRLSGPYDLVISAVALHWLAPGRLLKLYGRVADRIAPGGWFLNADHMWPVEPAIRDRFARLRVEQRAHQQGVHGAADWSGFWDAMARELAVDLATLRQADRFWEGTDEGLPVAWHLDALRGLRFDPVAVLWQNEGDALTAARRPES